MKLALLIFFSLHLGLAASATPSASYVPSNTDEAREIFVIYNASNAILIEDLARLIIRKNALLSADKKVRLTILVSESYKTEVDQPLNANPSPEISKYMAKDVPDDAGGTVDWLQDSGEFFYDTNGKPSFLQHKNSAEYALGSFLKRRKNIQLKVVQDSIRKHFSTEGGNIEGMPGGSVYVGDNLNPTLVKALTEIVGQGHVVKVDTKHASVGHVDESFQFLPAPPDKSNGCGYVLAFTDLLDGLQITMASDLFSSPDRGDGGPDRPVTAVEYLDSIAYFTGVDLKNTGFDLSTFYSLINKFDFKKLPRKFSGDLLARKEDIYVYKAFLAEKELLQGVNVLKAQAAKDGCTNLKTVSIPSLWTLGFNTFEGNFEGSISDLLKIPTSNMTAFTNMIVINDAVVIPDATAPTQIFNFLLKDEFQQIGTKLKEVLTERLVAIGFKPEDIIYSDVSGSLLGDGAAHCKTNVQRQRR